MIPIKIETLLEGRKVEQNRIEYKEALILQILCIQYVPMLMISRE